MKPLEKEAFAIIFEKVWATIRGGYNKLSSGTTYEVLNKVLGTSSQYLYNDDMKIFDVEPIDYYINKYYKSFEYYDFYKKIQKVKESDYNWRNKISTNNSYKKINSKNVFETIRDAQKNEGAIITVSINMNQSGHAYSILGTYTKENPKTGKNQDFIILKNPWRSGNDIIEKLNIPKIEKLLYGLDNIIKINRNHYKTGVFYMPKEYFEGWFRNICMCKPDYKNNFPKVYEILNLYKAISEYYNIKAGSSFFDSIQGNELIKTDIISKENYESLLKIIQHNKSNFIYVYDLQNLGSIWYDGNDNIEILCDYCFELKKHSSIVKIKKREEINNFGDSKIYMPKISIHKKKDKYYRIIRMEKINLFLRTMKI